MRFYAERPGRAARQLLGDLLVVAWTVGVVLVARLAFDLVIGLGGQGQALQDAGNAIRGAFAGAAGVAGGVPFVGSDLAKAFGAGADAGSSLAEAGQRQGAMVSEAAVGLGIGIVVLAAVPVLLVWLALRVRYARRAASAAVARELGPDLLALRALSRRPTRELLQVCPDPAAAWRAQDANALRVLAALELRTLGLRPPREVRPFLRR